MEASGKKRMVYRELSKSNTMRHQYCCGENEDVSMMASPEADASIIEYQTKSTPEQNKGKYTSRLSRVHTGAMRESTRVVMCKCLLFAGIDKGNGGSDDGLHVRDAGDVAICRSGDRSSADSGTFRA